MFDLGLAPAFNSLMIKFFNISSGARMKFFWNPCTFMSNFCTMVAASAFVSVFTNVLISSMELPSLLNYSIVF
ncbi:hypothetical protein ACFPFV_11695 [Salinicoccus siamensis]|uniref:hypothetical protein n=1 Tax=Salinicoccus siamensis TaxID=381830 RepID=UPI00361AAD4C